MWYNDASGAKPHAPEAEDALVKREVIATAAIIAAVEAAKEKCPDYGGACDKPSGHDGACEGSDPSKIAAFIEACEASTGRGIAPPLLSYDEVNEALLETTEAYERVIEERNEADKLAASLQAELAISEETVLRLTALIEQIREVLK